jgi:hypothetical protein
MKCGTIARLTGMCAPAVSGLAHNSRSTNQHAGLSIVELVVIDTYLSALVPKHIRGRAEGTIARRMNSSMSICLVTSAFSLEFHHHVKPERHLIVARVLRERLELIGQRPIIANFRTDQ